MCCLWWGRRFCRFITLVVFVGKAGGEGKGEGIAGEGVYILEGGPVNGRHEDAFEYLELCI